MSTRAASAIDAIGQALRPAFLSRRAHLTRVLALAATCFLASAPIDAQKRREVILQLRDDVATAMAHVSLEEKQTQKLDRCRQTLLLATQSRPRSATKKDLDSAVSDIEKLFHKGQFLEEDRKTVAQDIHQLRMIERNQQLRRNPRRWP